MWNNLPVGMLDVKHDSEGVTTGFLEINSNPEGYPRLNSIKETIYV